MVDGPEGDGEASVADRRCFGGGNAMFPRRSGFSREHDDAARVQRELVELLRGTPVQAHHRLIFCLAVQHLFDARVIALVELVETAEGRYSHLSQSEPGRRLCR